MFILFVVTIYICLYIYIYGGGCMCDRLLEIKIVLTDHSVHIVNYWTHEIWRNGGYEICIFILHIKFSKLIRFYYIVYRFVHRLRHFVLYYSGLFRIIKNTIMVFLIHSSAKKYMHLYTIEPQS